MTKKTYNNKTTYTRCPVWDEKHPFTILSHYLIKDPKLNVTELGIMVRLLSNQDRYVFNSEYSQENSGIGKVRWYKSIKHLIELGYINKKRFEGGTQWQINEIAKPLQHTDSLNTLEINTLEINTLEINSIENKSTETESIMNKNAPTESPQAGTQLEMNNNEMNNNETPVVENLSLGLKSEEKTISSDLEEDVFNQTIPIVKNDLELILNHSPMFRDIYDNAKWHKIDISKLSNSYMAFLTCNYYQMTTEQQIQEHHKNNLLALVNYLVKYSQTLPSSDLWKAFTWECQQAHKEDIIEKIIL